MDREQSLEVLQILYQDNLNSIHLGPHGDWVGGWGGGGGYTERIFADEKGYTNRRRSSFSSSKHGLLLASADRLGEGV